MDNCKCLEFYACDPGFVVESRIHANLHIFAEYCMYPLATFCLFLFVCDGEKIIGTTWVGLAWSVSEAKNVLQTFVDACKLWNYDAECGRLCGCLICKLCFYAKLNYLFNNYNTDAVKKAPAIFWMDMVIKEWLWTASDRCGGRLMLELKYHHSAVEAGSNAASYSEED